MATAFDPTQFIEAENSRCSQTIAAPATDQRWTATDPKPAENCGCLAAPPSTIAAIAAIAASDEKPLPWDRELRAFVDLECPPGVQPAYWSELVEEAWDISRKWGQAALDAGWSSLDLFGCNPVPSAGRVDRDGLVALNVGMRTPLRLISITKDSAELHDPRGGVLQYRPPPAPGSVHLWEAYAAEAGP